MILVIFIYLCFYFLLVLVKVLRALDCQDDMPDLSNGVKYGQSQFNPNSDIKKFRQMAFGSDTSSYEYDDDDYDRRSSQAALSGEYRSREHGSPMRRLIDQSSGELQPEKSPGGRNYR